MSLFKEILEEESSHDEGRDDDGARGSLLDALPWSDLDSDLSRLRRELRRAHLEAVARSISDSFPELRSRNVVVFLQPCNLDPDVSNAVIIERSVSETRPSVKTLVLEVVVDKVVEEYAKREGVPKLLLRAVLRREPGFLRVELDREESRRLRGSLGVGAPEGQGIHVGIDLGGERRWSRTLLDGRDLRRELVEDVVRKVVEEARGGIVLVEYYSALPKNFLRELLAKLGMNENVVLFLDRLLDDVEMLGLLDELRPKSVLIISDSVLRYRRLSYSYIRHLRSECEGSRKLRDFSRFLALLSRYGVDMEIVERMKAVADTSPGVIFKIMFDALTKLYVSYRRAIESVLGTRVSNIEKGVQELEKRRNNPRGLLRVLTELIISRLRKEGGMYITEGGGYAYRNYMALLERWTGVEREQLEKVVCVLGAYAWAQRLRGKLVLMTVESIAKRLRELWRDRETARLVEKLPRILSAMKRVGLLDMRFYMGRWIVMIMRPTLLVQWVECIEERNPDVELVQRSARLSLLGELKLLRDPSIVRRLLFDEEEVMVSEDLYRALLSHRLSHRSRRLRFKRRALGEQPPPGGGYGA